MVVVNDAEVRVDGTVYLGTLIKRRAGRL